MKRFFTTILVLAFMFALVPKGTTMAETSGVWQYEVNGTKATITGYTGTDSDVTIPEKVDGYKVTEIGDEAFRNNLTVKKVTMPSTLVKIRVYAFQNCENLQEVVLNENLEEIEGCAFADCDLRGLTLPKSLLSVGWESFDNNKNLSEVTIKSEMLSGGNCFQRAGSNLDDGITVTFKGSVKYVNGGLFSSGDNGYYAKVTKVIIEKGAERLTCGFYGCIDLETVMVFEDNLIYSEGLYCPYGINPNLIVYCNENSTAWKYAKAYGYTVQPLPESGTPTPTPPVLYANGDMNGDGKINTADAVIILKIAAGIIPMP